ncbi:MAG: DUF4349 domain-containing protein [Chloroflexota bacterium]
MSWRRWMFVACCGLLLVLGFVACQPQTVQVTRVVTETETVTETVVEEGETVEVTRVVYQEVESDAAEEEAEQGSDGLSAQATVQPAQQTRLIIKDGRMTVVVQETETAVNSATSLVIDLGGYLLSQSIYDDEQGYRFATMRLAVPVNSFEDVMRSLRRLGQVTDESASGTDVTDEFVDLESRLTNLEATRDRLRSFLDEAENVDETLKVNDELKLVEEEIAVIQGRLNYLGNRAAFSTVDLNIQPWIPTPTPSPTPTATPTATPTPLPTPETWRPADTAKVAGVELQESAQETADFFIYYGIVCGPWIVILLLFGAFFWWIRRRFGPEPIFPAQTATTAPAESEPIETELVEVESMETETVETGAVSLIEDETDGGEEE